MARNLVVCCDGTGNIWDNDYDTNVVKLTRLLTKSESQILYYDPGVGTSNTYPSIGLGNRIKTFTNEVVGLAFGGGVYENIGEAYGFLVEQYQPGDRIFLFGFSRGAFTVRCLAGMVNLFGITRPGTEPMIPTMTRIYFQPFDKAGKSGKTRESCAEDIRAVFTREGKDARVYFLGVWDTVSTVGGLPLSKKNITSSATIAGKNYDHVRHAVALDEYRQAYAPRLYLGESKKQGKDLNFDSGDKSVKQIWFTGAHSDVGGSYKEEGLSNCSLKWMVEEAIAKGLQCNQERVNAINPDPLALAHDQAFKQPLWALTGLQARKIPMEAVLHDSVKIRHSAVNTGSQPATVWKPFLKNRWAIGSHVAVFALLGVLFCLGRQACLSDKCGEFNKMLLDAFIANGSMREVLSGVDRTWMMIRYVADYFFIVAYTSAICCLLVYARRALAERSENPQLHRMAHWGGLIPIWSLISSDVVENAITIRLLAVGTEEVTSHTFLYGLLAAFTGAKLLSMAAIACFFLWVLYHVWTKKRISVFS